MDSTGGDRSPYVFLSYASADRERALHIAALLEAQSISVWIDRKSIAGGTSWSAEIVSGIESSSALVILCTAGAMTSPNVQQEVQLAWEGRKPILPLLLLPDCRHGGSISGNHGWTRPGSRRKHDAHPECELQHHHATPLSELNWHVQSHRRGDLGCRGRRWGNRHRPR